MSHCLDPLVVNIWIFKMDYEIILWFYLCRSLGHNVMLYTINRQRNHLWKRSLDLLALNQDPSITCPQREQDKDYPIKEVWLWSYWNLNENSVRIIRLKRYGYEVIYTAMTIHFLIWFPFSNSSVYHLDGILVICVAWNI
jgi:hypothetical protein